MIVELTRKVQKKLLTCWSVVFHDKCVFGFVMITYEVMEFVMNTRVLIEFVMITKPKTHLS